MQLSAMATGIVGISRDHTLTGGAYWMSGWVRSGSFLESLVVPHVRWWCAIDTGGVITV